MDSSSEADALRVRHVLAGEHVGLRELRLEALSSDPEAFGSTYDGNLTHPSEFWQRGAAESERGIDERTFLLVDAADGWLGMAFARLDAVTPDVGWLGGMWIFPKARRRGGAALLCEACLDWGRERGAKKMMLTVVVSNTVAQRAYEAAGFTVRERSQRSYHGRTLDEFVMARPI